MSSLLPKWSKLYIPPLKKSACRQTLWRSVALSVRDWKAGRRRSRASGWPRKPCASSFQLSPSNRWWPTAPDSRKALYGGGPRGCCYSCSSWWATLYIIIYITSLVKFLILSTFWVTLGPNPLPTAVFFRAWKYDDKVSEYFVITDDHALHKKEDTTAERHETELDET